MKRSPRPIPPGALLSSVAFLPLQVTPNHIANSDVLAWSLLSVLGLTLALVSACAWAICRQFRRGRQASPETQLLEEIQRLSSPQSATAPPVPTAPAQPWERPADWWQNSPQD